ncbi:TPA: PIN domain-containing protein [Candidatus Bathyarchaeota archaeon]|nr:PIN domain-containing protein [Candidatus Bathyarchaeota archaeon]
MSNPLRCSSFPISSPFIPMVSLRPTLIVYELGNVFWKHPQITSEKAHVFIKKFLDLQINLVDIYSDDELLKAVCNISQNKEMTFYDAYYIALAEKYERKLITADMEICNKSPANAILLEKFKSEL